MYGSSIAYMVYVVLAVLWTIFLILAVLDLSLVRIGIAAAVFVAAFAVQMYRRKRLKDAMEDLERRK